MGVMREARQAGYSAASSAATTRAGRAKVNYATLEHAGEPHRGRITEAEKELVRTHLDEINQRLAERGMREIQMDSL